MTTVRRPISPAIIFLAIALAACQPPSRHTGTRPEILTTIAPLYCFTINISGGLADAKNLLPPGMGPHEYSLRPSDIRKIATASLLIKNGVNLESWLDKALLSADRLPPVTDTSKGVEIMGNNPHIWISPRNAVIQVKNITEAIVGADPGHEAIYRANAENYIRRLLALDMEIEKETDTWGKREFVAFHPAFSYFARDYGLDEVAVIQESPEKEPSPKHIAHVIESIKARGIETILAEKTMTSGKILKSIAGDLNLQVSGIDTLETGEVYPRWYEDKMRENVAVLKKTLGKNRQ